MSRFCDENKVKVCKFGERKRLDNRENVIYLLNIEQKTPSDESVGVVQILKSMFW